MWRDVADTLRDIDLQELAYDIEMMDQTGKNNKQTIILC